MGYETMIRVFLSYTSNDAQIVEKIMRFLEEEEQKIECWNFVRDRNSLQTRLRKTISQEIDKCDYFIIFWSKQLSQSEAWVQSEYEQANSKEMALINKGDNHAFVLIIRVDNTPLPTWLQGPAYTLNNKLEITNLKNSIIKGGRRVEDVSIPFWEQSIFLIATSKEDLLICRYDDTVKDAFILMDAAGVRHLIIVDYEDRVVGIVSKRDILRVIPPKLKHVKIQGKEYQSILEEASKIPLNRIMTTFANLIYLQSTSSIIDAVIQFVNEHNRGRISALPILDEDNYPVGIVSYADVLCHHDIVLPDSFVGQYCSCDPNSLILVKHNDTVAHTWLVMKETGKRHIPIKENDTLVGMIDDMTVLWLNHTKIKITNEPVSKYMDSLDTLHTIQQQDKVSDIIERLLCVDTADKKITSLLVVENGELIGTFSYVDALRAIYEQALNRM